MKKIEQFDKYMKFKGLNDNKVTTQLGISTGTIGKSRKPNRDLSDKVIEQILNFYTDLNEVWLLTGEGEMLKHSSPTATINAPNHGLISVGNHTTNTYNKTHPAPETEESEALPTIPRNLYEDTEVDVFEYVTKNVVPTSPRIQQLPSYSMCYQVYSDELVPDIIPGDRLYIKPHNDVRKIIDGKPYVLETSTNGLMLRILYKGDTGLRASTKSQKYRDEYVPFEDIVRVYRILGLLRANI